jgi:hypothetical protein
MGIYQPCDRLAHLVAKYPFLIIHQVGIDCTEVRFIYHTVCDASLTLTTTYNDNKVRIKNGYGNFEFILDTCLVGGIFRCISSKMTKEMYYTLFELNIDVYNSVHDVVGIRRQWVLDKIINDD